MILTNDKMEKLFSSAEENERMEEEIEEEKGEEEEDGGNGDNDKYEKGENDIEKDDSDDKEKEEQVVDKTEKNVLLPVQSEDKKTDDVLNLNNEVVKMRKEVKRVRALIIRKLTRHISALKKKKGEDSDIQRNHRRMARLLEEIKAMRVLSPDLVTKTALQKKINFEEVCKNPKATISDRAVARIATHPQFNKKIESLKAAVKAFKDERMKSRKQGGKETIPPKTVKVKPQSPDKINESGSEKKAVDVTVELKEMSDNEEEVGFFKDTQDATVTQPKRVTTKASNLAHTINVQKKEREQPKDVTPASNENSEIQNVETNKLKSKNAAKKLDSVVHQKEEEEQESDLESTDEEKEYFDDSTEERFHKQSSQSEESDDDFFLGKVSKYKKKKSKSKDGEKKVDKACTGIGDSDKVKTAAKAQSELEPKVKSKVPPLQSIFYSSLSGSKPTGVGGAGRGKGGDRFRDQKKPKSGSGLNRNFSNESKFQKQITETEKDLGSKYNKPFPEGRGRGNGRGRGGIIRQNSRTGGGAFSCQAPQQALHPSWEASKKRKEQQGQILAFQGKKIKFDDDD
ncbi:serum response factor-binding protein 1 [Echeneis naucrates]|uniref:Serum response factor-binding protein 1 n=1 Tax=Echeneis naucrates TaxID=173247 RepID=A0A665UFI8_ECHNA|nr:serum response factor-binding protein 1 [Echeneis naucrates]